MKRKFIAILFVLAVLMGSAAMLGGCKEPAPEPTPAPVIKLTLNREVATIFINEEIELFTTLGEQAVTPEWSTSNAEIATVNGGKVKGVKEGEAVITATHGEYTANCYVTVKVDSEIPVLSVSNVSGDEISFHKQDTFALQPTVRFKGEYKEGATFSYSSDNQDVAVIDANGVITTKEFGKAKITVTASWQEFGADILTYTLNVTVLKNIEFSLDIPSTPIYGVASLEGRTFVNTLPTTPSLKIEGADVFSGFTFESSDTGILTVNNVGVITGVKPGTAEVICSYVDEGITFTVSKAVEVSLAVTDKNLSSDLLIKQDTANVSAFNGIFTDGKTITEIQDVTGIANGVGEKITVQENGGLERNGDYIKKGERTLRIFNDIYALNVNVVVYNRIITTAQQLKTELPALEKTNICEDYIILGNDITNVGEWNHALSSEADCQFKGVLDGRGHVISNIDIKGHGLFRNIAATGGVKNLAIVNATNSQTAAHGAILAGWNYGTIDNVYVQGNILGDKGMGGMVSVNNGSISNSVANVNTAVSQYVIDGVYGVICGGASVGTTENCYGITTTNKVVLYVSNWAVNKTNLYATGDAFLAAINGVVPSGLKAEYWEISDNDLYFSANEIISYVEPLALAEGKNELFYFDTKLDSEKSADYIANYTSDSAANYLITLPDSVTGLTGVIIDSTVITGFTFNEQDHTLKIPTEQITAIANRGNATMYLDYSLGMRKATVVIADYVITSAAELKTVIPYVDENITADYVVLGNDITSVGDYTGASGEIGFNGTFDGMGYAIKDINIKSNGLFHQILTSATVKNFAMLNVSIDAYAALATTLYGKVDNVYIQGTATTGPGAMIGNGVYAGTVSNCIVNVNATGAYADGNYYGLIAGAPGVSSSAINVTNCYGVSTNTGVRLYSLGGYGGSPQGQENIKASGAELLTAFGGMPTGFNKYWKIDDGKLYFGANQII